MLRFMHTSHQGIEYILTIGVFWIDLKDQVQIMKPWQLFALEV